MDHVAELRSMIARFNATRMRGMLMRCHTDAGAYARSLPFAELARQVSVCRACQQAKRCDRALISLADTSRPSFSFCPNKAAIEEHLPYR